MRQSTGTVHRVTARVAVPVVLAFVLLNLLWLSGNAWFLLLAGAAVGVLVVGVSGRARLDGLTVTLSHEPRVTVGEAIPCVLTVANAGARPSSEATLSVHMVGLEDLTAYVGRLAPGESVSLPVTRTAEARGVADRAVVHLASRPSLGLVAATHVLQGRHHLTVHPRLHAVPAAAVTRVPRAGSDSPVVAGRGAEVIGVREWRPGDDRLRVHWRSTARTGRVTLLERGDVMSYELRLVLVGSDLSPDFEAALGTAASWCDSAVRAGSQVTVAVWHGTGPVLGPPRSRWELLDWWSSVQGTVLPEPAEFGSTILAGFGAGELLVAGPAEVDADWLAAAQKACPGLVLRRLETAGRPG